MWQERGAKIKKEIKKITNGRQKRENTTNERGKDIISLGSKGWMRMEMENVDRGKGFGAVW